MARPGLPSLGGIAGLPADAIAALRELMERILTGIDGLNASVDTLQGAVKPLASLAGRVPGRKKG